MGNKLLLTLLAILFSHGIGLAGENRFDFGDDRFGEPNTPSHIAISDNNPAIIAPGDVIINGVHYPAPGFIGGAFMITPTIFRPIGGGPFIHVPRFFDNVAHNNSPIPRDRFFVVGNLIGGYRDFDAQLPVPSDGKNAPVRQVIFGLEKRLFDGNTSIELLLPIVTAEDPMVSVLSPNATNIGRIAVSLKHLFWQNEHAALSAGVRISLPTEEQTVLGPLVYENDATFYQLFIAGAADLGDGWFAQGFASWRFGDDHTRSIAGVPQATTARDPDTFAGDIAIGKWLPVDNAYIAALVPSVEFHYARTVEGLPRLFNQVWFGKEEQMDVTVGATAYFHDQSSLGVGLSLPANEEQVAFTIGPLAGIQANQNSYYNFALTLSFNKPF